MVHRNHRGQILIEALFLIALMFSALIYFDHLIQQQRSQTEKTKLSYEKKKGLKYENTKNKFGK